MKYFQNERLSKHTSFKIGGPAKYLCIPKEIDELKKALRFAKLRKLKILIIGLGSNLLISDKGFDGLVIKPKMSSTSINGTNVMVESGMPIQKMLNVLAGKGLSGLEFMAGIPGSVGGAVCMNAGQGGSVIGDRVKRVWALDLNGKERVFLRSSSRFGNRGSIFQGGRYVITKVELGLKKGSPYRIKRKIRSIIKGKLLRQPYDSPSAGSVFKNPNGDFAGRLIEGAGGKGMKVGDALVSKKHANFIVNLGRAKSGEVLKLMSLAKKKVWDKFRIKLEPEIKIVQ